MAIQGNWTDPATGVTLNQAYGVLDDPAANESTHQVVVEGHYWESSQSYLAGKQPYGTFVATLDSTVYDELRSVTLDVVEPALVAMLGGDATRVPD